MASEFTITRRVEFSETDLAGIMHFTNFYRWMEICEHEFLRSLGLSVDMEDENGRFGWPRVKTSCRFKRPLRFEEVVEVKLIVAEIRDRSIRYAFQFWKEENGEQVKAAVGEAVAACVRFEQATGSMTPIMIPEVVRNQVSEASSKLLESAVISLMLLLLRCFAATLGWIGGFLPRPKPFGPKVKNLKTNLPFSCPYSFRHGHRELFVKD